MFVLKKLVHGNVGGSTVNVLIHNQVFHHSHKKQHSLETCARLLFMLLQDFFASARKMFVTEKCSTLFVPPKIKYYRSKENHQ